MEDECKEEFINKRIKWYRDFCGYKQEDSEWYSIADWYEELEK